MNRREFLTGSAAGTIALLTGIKGCRDTQNDATEKRPSVTNQDNKLAGLTLEELRERHRYYLFDDFLPFLEKYVIDHKYGGFICNTDRDGTNLTQNKKTWYEDRAIWVYFFLYNKIAREQKYLNIASKSVEFIQKNEPKGDTLYPEEFTCEGKPLTEPSTSIYGDLFVANGFSEYSKAIRDDAYWQKAKALLFKCLKIYDNPDYAFHADYGPEVPPFKGERALGLWMIMLRLVTQMLEFKTDPELEQYGYPIWILYADRKVTFVSHYDRVGNFHHPRHLMLNMLSLDRMIKRKGWISRYFG